MEKITYQKQFHNNTLTLLINIKFISIKRENQFDCVFHVNMSNDVENKFQGFIQK